MKIISKQLSVLLCLGLVSCAGSNQYPNSLKYASDLSKYVAMVEFEKYWEPETKAALRYPRRLLEREQPGCVLVGMFVGADGLVKDTEVVQQWPDSTLFARAALRAVSQFHFRPTAANTNNTPMWSVHLITFTFEGVAPAGNVLNTMCAA